MFTAYIVGIVVPLALFVYIMYEHPNIRNYIWPNIFSFGKHTNPWFLIIYMIFAIILVFIMCIMIDLIRKEIYKALKHIPFIQNGIEKINQKLKLIGEKINS